MVMKMKIQHTITVLAFSALCGGLSAQNLNPTVSVSREYQGKLMEVSKPAVKMAVPDSLTEFNLKSTIPFLRIRTRARMTSSPTIWI